MFVHKKASLPPSLRNQRLIRLISWVSSKRPSFLNLFEVKTAAPAKTPRSWNAKSAKSKRKKNAWDKQNKRKSKRTNNE
jgi:hypothetical protein